MINNLPKTHKFKIIFTLVGIGVGVVLISWLLNILTGFIIDFIFRKVYIIENNEMIWSNVFLKIIYSFVKYIICIDITEELAKNLIKYFYVEDNLEYKYKFNTMYDYIIIFLIVSMTFSILEDFLYVFVWYKEDESTGILRLLTDPIGHIFWAIILGNYYYKLKVEDKAYSIKSKLTIFIKEFEKTNIFESDIELDVKGFIVAILLHGIYDFFTQFALIWIFLFVACYVLFIVCMIKLKNCELFNDGIDCIMRHQKIYTKDEFIQLYIEQRR